MKIFKYEESKSALENKKGCHLAAFQYFKDLSENGLHSFLYGPKCLRCLI